MASQRLSLELGKGIGSVGSHPQRKQLAASMLIHHDICCCSQEDASKADSQFWEKLWGTGYTDRDSSFQYCTRVQNAFVTSRFNSHSSISSWTSENAVHFLERMLSLWLLRWICNPNLPKYFRRRQTQIPLTWCWSPETIFCVLNSFNCPTYMDFKAKKQTKRLPSFSDASVHNVIYPDMDIPEPDEGAACLKRDCLL